MKKHLKKLLLLTMTFQLLFFFNSCSEDSLIEENLIEQNIQNQELENHPELAYPNIVGEFIPIDSNLLDGLNLEKINNEYILSGDIILTEKQKKDILNNRISNNNGSTTQSKTGLSSLSTRWTNCTVYYKISSTLSNQSRVIDAIAHWESNYSINFVLRTTQTNYIEFVPSTGCSSFLGMIGGRQEIRLASGCSTGNAIHEIGHALGFLHEQQRTDRDSSIIINWSNIQSGTENNFRTYTEQGIGGYQIGQFDFGSIMLYGSYGFSNNGLPTIIKLDGSTFIGQRDALSIGDIEMIDDMYNCSSPVPIMLVDITGPPFANNSSYYTWTASATDGTAPYTYNWFYSNNQGQTYIYPWGSGGSSITVQMPDGQDLYIKVIATDSNGNTAEEEWMTTNTGAGWK